jgi:hypothetical protein
MPRRTLTPAPAPAPIPAPGTGLQGLPSHLSRPKVISLDAFPQHKAYVEALPVGHPDIREIYSLAYDAQNGNGDAQQTLTQQLPPTTPSANYAAFGKFPANPQSMSPTTATSSPYTPGLGENLANAGGVLAANLDAGLMQGGRAMAVGTGLVSPEAARRDAALSQPMEDKFSSMVAPNPVAQGAMDFLGGAARFGGAMVPYLNPVTGGLAGGGQAQIDDKSAGGTAFNYALGAVPGAAAVRATRGLQALTRAPEVVAATAANAGLGGVMMGSQAAETALFEDNPELAQQEAQAILPSAGAMGALGSLGSLLTRGRAGFHPVPRQTEPAPVLPGAQPPFNPDITVQATAPFGLEAVPGERGKFRTQLPPAAEPIGPANQVHYPILPEISKGNFNATAYRPGPGEMGIPDGPLGAFTPVRNAQDELGMPSITPGRFHPTGELPGAGELGIPDGAPGAFVPVRNARDDLGMPSITRGDEVTVMRTPQEQIVIPPENIGGEMRDEAGMPYAVPGFRTNDRPRPVREGGFYEAEPGAQEGYTRPPPTRQDGYSDAAPGRQEGYREPPPMAREGYFEANTQPRRPDHLPQFRDTTATGEDPVILERTHTGSDLSPVDVPEPYTPRTNGSIRGNQTPAQDPYGDIDARVAARRKFIAQGGEESEFGLPPVRVDQSLPDTEVSLDRVSDEGVPTRRDMPAFRAANSSNIRPQFQTTAERPPLRIRPGERKLSPEAQEFLSGLKPGQRAAIKDTIEARVRGGDREGDLGNLQFAHQIAEGNAAKAKSQLRPKDEPPTRGRSGNTLEQTPTPEPVPSSRPDRTGEESPVEGEGPRTVTNVAGPDPKALTDAVKGVGEALSGVKHRTLDLWSKRLYQVVGDMPGGKALATKARSTLDRARSLMGQFEADRARFHKELRGRTPAAKATRKSFEEVTWDGNTGYARIQQLFDKKTPPRAHEAAAINAYARAFLDTGKAAQTAGYKIRVGDKLIPFTADPSRLRAPRVGTNDLHWLSQRPGDDWTKALADDIAKANPGMTSESVLKELNMWGERGLAKRGLAEDARTIENFPTHWKTPDGKVIQLLETDPARLIDAVTQRFPARIAYVEHFGQDGIPPEMTELMSKSGEQGKQAGLNLHRALNGMPLDTPGGGSSARPGSLASLLARSAEIPWSAFKGAKLQLAPLANLPETLGKARVIAGSNPLKFIKAGFDVSFLNRNSGAILDDLSKRGAFTRDVMDWYWNKSDVPETLNRYVINTTSAVNRLVNEFNERLSARMSQMWSDSLREGKGGAVDRIRLKVLDFSDTEIDAIMKGKATEAQYDAVLGRATEWAQASTSQAAERSRAGGTRWWNTITLADRFAQMNINRNFGAMSKAAKVVADGNSSWKDRVGAVALATDLVAGQTAAAAVTLIMRAAVVGGAAALTDKAFGSPAGVTDFLSEAMAYALLGGPAQAVIGAASQDKGNSVAESLGSTILPIGAAQEAVDAFHGTGRYQDMTMGEKATTFLKSSQPLTGVATNVMGVLGVAEDNPKLNGAVREFWKWREKYAPASRTMPAPGETDVFRSNMRKAAKAIQAGTDPSEAVAGALGERDNTSVAASLRSRKFLAKLKPEQRMQLTDYLGEATVQELQDYDNLLEAWASAIKPKRR